MWINTDRSSTLGNKVPLAKRKSLASGSVDAGAERPAGCVMIVLWSFLVWVIDVSTEWKAIVDNEIHKVFRDF